MTITFNHKALTQKLNITYSIENLNNILGEASREFNIGKFLVTSMPSTSGKRLSEFILSSNLSPDLLSEYDKLGMLKYSTHFQALRQTNYPRIWQTDMMDEHIAVASSENIKQTREFLYNNSISMGCSFPVYATNGHHGVVIFMGDRDQLDELSIIYLNMIASFSYEFICNLNQGKAITKNRLSKRECEILTWVADGKTSHEIAIILSVSDHTINTHLRSAMQKLDCVTRTQLVAKALRLGMIV